MSRLSKRIERMKSCEYWVIAYRKRDHGENLLSDGGKTGTEGFRLLPQKKFITQADPFLYTYRGETWLFYERQELTDMKGTLWCVNLDDPERGPAAVLEESFHLSYPQVFGYGGEIYMLPETRNAGDIRLYRCVEFPGRWELAESLFDMEAVDTTLMWDDSLMDGHACYLFTYTEKRLEIYHCRLEQERFHIISREKLYVSEASDTVRPGGGIIRENGRLLRPAQNCSDYYGRELLVNEIDGLDGRGFGEHIYCRLSPAGVSPAGVNPIGIHTYNRNERYEAIDLLHREISMGTVCKKIEWKLRGSGI